MRKRSRRKTGNKIQNSESHPDKESSRRQNQIKERKKKEEKGRIILALMIVSSVEKG